MILQSLPCFIATYIQFTEVFQHRTMVWMQVPAVPRRGCLYSWTAVRGVVSCPPWVMGTNLKSSVKEYALIATKAPPQPLVLLKLWGFVFSSLPYSSYCRCHYCSQTWKFHCLASYSWYSWYSWYCLWILTMLHHQILLIIINLSLLFISFLYKIKYVLSNIAAVSHNVGSVFRMLFSEPQAECKY